MTHLETNAALEEKVHAAESAMRKSKEVAAQVLAHSRAQAQELHAAHTAIEAFEIARDRAATSTSTDDSVEVEIFTGALSSSSSSGPSVMRKRIAALESALAAAEERARVGGLLPHQQKKNGAEKKHSVHSSKRSVASLRQQLDAKQRQLAVATAHKVRAKKEDLGRIHTLEAALADAKRSASARSVGYVMTGGHTDGEAAATRAASKARAASDTRRIASLTRALRHAQKVAVATSASSRIAALERALSHAKVMHAAAASTKSVKSQANPRRGAATAAAAATLGDVLEDESDQEGPQAIVELKMQLREANKQRMSVSHSGGLGMDGGDADAAMSKKISQLEHALHRAKRQHGLSPVKAKTSRRDTTFKGSENFAPRRTKDEVRMIVASRDRVAELTTALAAARQNDREAKEATSSSVIDAGARGEGGHLGGSHSHVGTDDDHVWEEMAALHAELMVTQRAQHAAEAAVLAARAAMAAHTAAVSTEPYIVGGSGMFGAGVGTGSDGGIAIIHDGSGEAMGHVGRTIVMTPALLDTALLRTKIMAQSSTRGNWNAREAVVLADGLYIETRTHAHTGATPGKRGGMLTKSSSGSRRQSTGNERHFKLVAPRGHSTVTVAIPPAEAHRGGAGGRATTHGSSASARGAGGRDSVTSDMEARLTYYFTDVVHKPSWCKKGKVRKLVKTKNIVKRLEKKFGLRVPKEVPLLSQTNSTDEEEELRGGVGGCDDAKGGGLEWSGSDATSLLDRSILVVKCDGVENHFRAVPISSSSEGESGKHAATKDLISAFIGAGINADVPPIGIGATRELTKNVRRIVRKAKVQSKGIYLFHWIV